MMATLAHGLLLLVLVLFLLVSLMGLCALFIAAAVRVSLTRACDELQTEAREEVPRVS